MKIGYARISTKDQSFDLQIDALNKAGCEKIFKEVVSGIKTEKVELKEVMKVLRTGDTLVVWRLDRLGRSLKSLISFVNELKEGGIYFASIMDSIDTSSSMGQFFFHVTGAFAELERNLIHERTMAGIKASRARGIKGGRPKAIDPETFDIALKMYKTREFSVRQICEKLNITRRTFYRYMKNNRDLSAETLSKK